VNEHDVNGLVMHVTPTKHAPYGIIVPVERFAIVAQHPVLQSQSE
jgi:hypothetical protein